LEYCQAPSQLFGLTPGLVRLDLYTIISRHSRQRVDKEQTLTATASRSDIVCKRTLTLTDVKGNNNKYWEGILYENDDVLCRWGRVGAARGQEKLFEGKGLKYLETKIRSKIKKGYEEMDAADSPGDVEVKSIKGSGLKAVAKKQIRSSGCKTTDHLIDYLVQVNRHDIQTASGGRISVDDEGLVKTDVGRAVSQPTIAKARDHLVILSKCLAKADWESDAFCDNLNAYMKKIPQKVGARRGWEKTFFADQAAIQRQGSLLDSMESALKAFQATPIVTADGKEEQVFNVELNLISNGKEIDRINKLYRRTQKRMHACAHLKVKNVYSVHIEHMSQAFDRDGAKKNPVWELWHGTRAANLLSILKGGLVIPPSNAAHVCGRMFGNGAYFSDQSTKSLNYAYGYWNGASKDNNCFMFLANVGMGNFYTPRGPQSFPKGYDSVYAEGGKSGVQNNEMIVPRVSQCNLTRLIEFSA